MFKGTSEDRLAVRELIDAYCDAVARRDAIDWGATWAEDAVWIFRSGRIEGRDNIVATWKRAMAGYESVVFLAFPGAIVIEGDEARVTTHTMEHLKPHDGVPYAQAGQYEDRLVRNADGGWCFAERSFASRPVPLT